MREPPRLSLASRISLHNLVIRAEADDWIAGRTSSGQFVALPELGVTVIGLLSDGHTLGEAQEQLGRDLDETVEVVEFVEQLAELGFVRAVDGVAVDDIDQLVPSLPWLRPAHVGWMFSTPLLAAYAALITAAAVLLAGRPRLLPGYGDLLISRSPTAVVVTDTIITLVLMGLHELAHLAAARSVGVPARISWGTRLFDLVAQTSMPGVWAVGGRLRMRCYLAGIGFDVAFGSALIAAEATGSLPSLAGRFVRATVALLVLGLAMQLLVFKRTDVYFVLADLLRARNLHDDACVYLLTRGATVLSWLRPDRTPVSRQSAAEVMDGREYRLVRHYAWFMLAGSVASALALVAFIAPAVAALISRSVGQLTAGLSRPDYAHAADAGAAIAILIGSWVFFLIVFVRSRGPWWRRVRAGLPPSG